MVDYRLPMLVCIKCEGHRVSQGKKNMNLSNKDEVVCDACSAGWPVDTWNNVLIDPDTIDMNRDQFIQLGIYKGYLPPPSSVCLKERRRLLKRVDSILSSMRKKTELNSK